MVFILVLGSGISCCGNLMFRAGGGGGVRDAGGGGGGAPRGIGGAGGAGGAGGRGGGIAVSDNENNQEKENYISFILFNTC